MSDIEFFGFLILVAVIFGLAGFFAGLTSRRPSQDDREPMEWEREV